MRWTVKGFALPGMGTVIDEWESSADAKAVAKFDSRLDYLSSRAVPDWDYDYAHKLSGIKGIWEIKFEWANIAYRPLFYLGPLPEEFTVLFFAQERGGKWKPATAPATALLRMKQVTHNPSKALIHD